MAKDAYYFSHDSNAKDDPKCVMLIEQLGLEGYGIFWVLVETLRDQPEYKYPLALIPALARRYNTTAEKIKTVVMNYALFDVENDEFFYSNSLNRRMEKREALSEKQRQNVLKRWNNTTVLPEQCSGNTESYHERKGKESKGKENIVGDKPPTKQFIKPTIEEVKSYCLERKNNVSPQKWYDHYTSNGWKVGRNSMKDWKAAVRTWERSEKQNDNYGGYKAL